MAMFAIVKRSSILRFFTPSPVNSMGFIERAVHADHSDDMQDHILALTHLEGLPTRLNLIAEGTLNQAFPVAIPAAISVLPTPVENAPSAP